MEKQSWKRQSEHDHNSRVLLYAVNFVRAMLYPLSALFDPIKFLVFLVHSFRLSKRYKPHFIVASMPPLETGLSSWLLTKCKTSDLIIDLRDDWESARRVQLKRYFPATAFHVLSIISKKIYSNALLVFTATPTIAHTIKRRGVTTPTLLVPNGADTSIFIPKKGSVRKKIRAKYNLPLDRVIIVYCGSGTITYYRLDIVLSCVRFLPQEVKDKIYIVFYVYSGSNKLKQMLKKLGVTDKIVDIREPLPRKRLAEVLASCDVGMVPFDSDIYLLCARSTKLYEYLSSGLYVISSGPKNGELDELFSANQTLGLFIHPNAKDFALSMSHMLKKKEYLFNDALRRLRHTFIKENYDRRNIMETAMKDLLKRVRLVSS